MASSNVIAGLTADVTCSICLGLFDQPKSLENCLHTFCLRCLKQLEPEGTKIRCPECRELSALPKNGVEGFASNLVARNIVEKLKTQQPEILLRPDGDGVVCTHMGTSDKRENCQHCSKEFSHSCKYRHMEELKEKVAALFETNNDLSERLVAQDVLSRVNTIFERDVKSVRTLMGSLSDTVEKRVKAVIGAAVQFQDDEMSRIRSLFEMAADKNEPEQKRRRLGTVSIFKQQLSDIANLHNELSRRSEQLELLTSLQDGSSFVSFELKDVLETPKRFKDFEIGSFKLSDTGLKFSCKLPQLQSGNLNDESIASTSNTAPTVPPAARTSTNLPRPLPIKYDYDSYVVLNESRVKHPQAIIGHVYNSGYIVAHDDCCITLFDYQGVTKSAFRMQFNPDFRSFRIDDMTTNFRGAVFFAANVIGKFGQQMRQIYRFWPTEGGGVVEPSLFLESNHDECFRGLTASTRWRWLITTDAQFVVGYKSIDALKHERGTEVYRCFLGPSPYVYRTRLDDETISVKIVCSTNGVLRCWDVYPDENNRTAENVWRVANNSNALIEAKQHREFYFWGYNGLLVVDNSIQLYDGLPNNSIFLRKTLPLTLTPLPSAEKCVGVAGVAGNNGAAGIAVLYESGSVKFAQLTNK